MMIRTATIWFRFTFARLFSAVDMLIWEKAQGMSEWGSGPSYVMMLNNGFGIPPTNFAAGGDMGGGYGGNNNRRSSNNPWNMDFMEFMSSHSNSSNHHKFNSSLLYLLHTHHGRWQCLQIDKILLQSKDNWNTQGKLAGMPWFNLCDLMGICLIAIE